MRRLLLFNLATDESDPILGFAVSWVRALAARVEAVDVVTMRAGPSALPDNVTVHTVGKELGYSEPRRAVRFYAILGRLVARHRYDACFAHMMPLFATMAAPLLKVRRVPITLWYTQHATPPLLRAAERLVDRVVTAAPESFRVPSSKVIVTGHGIDTELFTPGPRGADAAFTVASVGRVGPVKRLEVLVDAVRLLAGDGVGVRCRIVGPVLPGDEAYERSLRERAGDIVAFRGPVERAALVDEYRRADVTVNASGSGLDKTVLESMACGVPVVTCNESAVDVVRAADPALAFAEPTPASLSAALRRVRALDAAARDALAVRCRDVVVRDHSLDRLADRLVDEIL